MITTIYNLSHRLYLLSAKHGRLGNPIREKSYFYISNALLEIKTFIQSL